MRIQPQTASLWCLNSEVLPAAAANKLQTRPLNRPTQLVSL